MTDLVEWLEAVISEDEAAAADVHEESCGYTRVEFARDTCSCDQPEMIRRRCKADREILELWRAVREAKLVHSDAFAAMNTVIRHVAEGYGYQEEA